MKKVPNFSIPQVMYFCRSAELASMSAAADELNVAQSSISSAIAQLEKSLGSRLLERKRAKGVILTESGRRFYEAGLALLQAVDEAHEAVGSDELSGRFKAGCFVTLAQFWLARLVEAFELSFPEIQLTTKEITAGEIAPMLVRRDVEAVVSYDFDYGNEVEFIPLATATLYAAFAAGHPFASRSSVSLTDLAKEPMVLLDLGKSSNYFLSIFRQRGIQPNVRYKFQSFEAVRSMVARGHGFTLLNHAPLHNLTNDGYTLVCIPVEDPGVELGIGVVHLAEQVLSSKANAFVEVCRREFEQVHSSGLMRGTVNF